MKGSFDFQLSEPIKYQSKGANEESKNITLYAPSVKSRKHCAKIRQLFFRSVQSLQKNNTQSQSTSNEGEIKGKEIVMMFLSSDIDMNEIYESFEQILINGHCKINNEQSIVKSHFDQFDLDDIDKILGEYMELFLLQYWLKTLNAI